MSTASSALPAIEVVDLAMAYGDNLVLDSISFRVDAGEVVCLLGPNGAGKTTTIEILEGFRTRSAGEVFVLGEDPATAGEAWRARTGVVLQSWRDHPRWTPRQLLNQMGGYYEPYATPQTERPWPLEDLLDLVGLTDIADRRIVTLSGGQRRRLDVALGIVGRPELLFLDEPTAGFDPKARREFHEMVHRLSDSDGTTIVLTTHDLAEAEVLADRVIVLAGGGIVADASADALARRMSGEAQVTWTQHGERFVHATAEPNPFLRDLLTHEAAGGGEVRDLEVRRASLEDAYLELVRRHESGAADVDGVRAAVRTFGEVAS